MSKILDPDCLLRYCHFSKIGPLDGKVGSITPGGTHFITSANQNFILAPPLGEREVRLRTDTRYGDDDPVLWPQPYMSHNCHFACIPRPNSLADHEIIWWTPTYDHFVPFRSSLSPVGGLGKLSPLKYGVLKSSVDSLLLRAKNYQEATAASSRPPMLQPIVKWLEHCLFQLGSVYATFRQVEFLVRDLQRVWLELRALLDYMEIFKPRIDGNAPAVIEPAETTGAFTTSVRVAQDFFTAGLPFWLLRPASELTDQVVHAVVELAQPESFPDLTLTPHPRYPVIFKGSSSSLEKYQSIHDFARNFLRCSDDPFKAPGVRQPSATFSSVPPLDPLNNQLDTQAGPSRRLPSVRPGPRRESGRQQSGQRSFRQQRGGQKVSGTPNRDKFAPQMDSPIAPMPLSSWHAALAAVQQDPTRVDVRYRSPNDRKYIFPEPGIFVAANEMRRTRYFATWIAIEPACIYRVLSSSSAPPLSNQEWRDILIGEISSRTGAASTARARALQILGSTVSELSIVDHDCGPSAGETLVLQDSEAQQILWRLTELNFRFELLALDRRAGRRDQDEVTRQESLCECLNIKSLLVVDAEEAKAGLASHDSCLRLRCLLKIMRLMRDWDGPTPPNFSQYNSRPIQDFREPDVIHLEETIARFYTDSFFRFFGRAAIIPVHVP